MHGDWLYKIPEHQIATPGSRGNLNWMRFCHLQNDSQLFKNSIELENKGNYDNLYLYLHFEI
jgi:hypothetical protein